MKCWNNQTLYVCESSAGFFIGTLDHNGQPFCRITNYYRQRSSAVSDLKGETFKERMVVKNDYCNRERCVIGTQVEPK